MSKQPTKQPKKQPAAPKKRHDPARTAANKARRQEKARLAQLRKAQDKADHKADHGSARFMRRARLSFLPGPQAAAVRKLQRRNSSSEISYTPVRMFFQLGQRARLAPAPHAVVMQQRGGR